MKKNKTIAIFSGFCLPHLGGIERYTDNLAKQLVKKGYMVIIVTSDYSFDNKYYEKIGNLIYLKIPVYKMFVSRYPIPKLNKNYNEVIRKLEKFDIDHIIVNTRFHLTSLIGAKYGYKKNIPVSLIEHGSQHLTVDNKLLDFLGSIYEHLLTRYIKRFVNYYYGVSEQACIWQKHFGIESTGVWYNSINDFSKKLNKNIEKDKINILYAGRILKQKGIIELISSFNNLTKKYNNIYLHIAGDGNLLDELMKNNNNNKIKFYGRLDFDELCNLYCKTDIFVYAPKWPEGLPTGILEAGLMECAVISSPQGGTKEIIEHDKNGIMINNEIELYNSLELLIENSNLRIRLAKNLKEKVLKKFCWDNTVKKIIKDINSNKKGD